MSKLELDPDFFRECLVDGDDLAVAPLPANLLVDLSARLGRLETSSRDFHRAPLD